MDKQGISELISIVMLIGIVVVLAAGILVWSTKFVTKTTEQTSKSAEKTIKCLNDIQLEILDACYDSKIEMTIENKKGTLINGDFLLIKVEGSNDIALQPTQPGTNLLPFDKKKIAITYFSDIGSIKRLSIIPRILTDSGPIFCTEQIAEFTNIKQGCN